MPQFLRCRCLWSAQVLTTGMHRTFVVSRLKHVCGCRDWGSGSGSPAQEIQLRLAPAAWLILFLTMSRHLDYTDLHSNLDGVKLKPVFQACPKSLRKPITHLALLFPSRGIHGSESFTSALNCACIFCSPLLLQLLNYTPKLSQSCLYYWKAGPKTTYPTLPSCWRHSQPCCFYIKYKSYLLAHVFGWGRGEGIANKA